MNRAIAVAVAFASITIGVAFAEPPTATNLSRAEVNDLMRSARTAEQYRTLAEYFKARQVSFEQQAQSEKQEWERRSQITAATYQKYPRPADSSKNRYEYFTYEAQQMGQQAAHYESLSTTASK
jgi:dsDNA-specific endonuclease/ATPase MutS2